MLLIVDAVLQLQVLLRFLRDMGLGEGVQERAGKGREEYWVGILD